ncbi:MAG TPA: hypothetical protein VFV71_06045 [Burkholderiales bacterium]|nr:hypothetical protein [Burkholderiales bacterium]
MLAIGTGFLVFSLAQPRADIIQKNAETDAALAQVKLALIGWSATRTPTSTAPTSRPGELPCPDMNNNGMDDDGGCAAGAIGRVPWQTLGIPEPKDGSGETIWYAIAGPFRYKAQANAPITSDTMGNLTVYLGSSAMSLTTQAVAVLFAPGPPVGSQARGATTTTCATTGTTIAQVNCAANYLEATGGGNNAQTGGPFIQAVKSASFNDRVLAITNADLMPAVEPRVAYEMMSYLNRYRAAIPSHVYPWADLSDGDSNGDPGTAAYNRGRFPCGNALPVNWGSSGTPTLPDWLTNGCPASTGWAGVIYYAVATNLLENGGTGCTTPGCAAHGGLNITNSGRVFLCTYGASPFTCPLSNVSPGLQNVLLLITPGGWEGGAHSWSNTTWSPITGYFEDATNGNNSNDNYAIPSSTSTNRDRMFIMQ